MELFAKKDWYKGGWFVWAKHIDGSGEYKFSDARFMTRREAKEAIEKWTEE